MRDRTFGEGLRIPAFEDAARLIRSASRPVITTHEYPDGDAIGSEIALAEALRSLGKTPLVLNSHVTPDVYAFLCREGEPTLYDPGRDVAGLKDTDLAIVLDANGWDRVGPVEKQLVNLCRPTICIDHHEPGQPFADVHVIDSSASSTSEVVYDFVERLGAEKTRRFGEAIYAGILFDTGSFRFSNTTPRCHEIVAELIGMGVQAEEMFCRVFESGTFARMRLFGLALQTLQSECGGRLAWFMVSKRMFEETGAREQDVEGFIDVVRSIKDAQIVLMFRDNRDGKVKGSFRSKSDAWDMYELARQFGGGGHRRASGVTLPGPLEDSAKKVVAAARTMFRE